MFRPCIDLHEGKVKQIVGETLSGGSVKTNFTAESKSSVYYAKLFKKDKLTGGHIIMLGSGNEEAAIKALKAYPGGMQIGGGINPDNAKGFLDSGASHVIVTSWVFNGTKLSLDKLNKMKSVVGKNRLVLDLSCKKVNNKYLVAINKWRDITNLEITEETINSLEKYCDELLIHAVDVEGKMSGIDTILVEKLSKLGEIPITYAGGAKSIEDLYTVDKISKGRIHLTIGSALDIFGGSGVRYKDAVEFNHKRVKD